MARIDKIKQALKNLQPEDKIELNNLVSGEYKNGEDDIYPNDEEFFNMFFSNDPYNAVQRAVYGDYQPMHDYVMFDGYGNLKSLDTYLLERNLISDDEIAEFLDENEQYIEDYLENVEEEEKNEVSEERYYDALEVLPPYYFDTLNGKKVSGGFAVGEPSAHRSTPDGFKATYSGYYKSGDKYFGVGEVYFVQTDDDGEPSRYSDDSRDAKTLDPEAFKTGGTTGRKPRLKKSDSVAIYGSRWFDRTYGNTYHTTELYVNDKLIETSDLTYGYDDGYIDTGLKMLEKHFVLPKGYNISMRWQLRDFVRSYVTRAVDVTRKKDLYAKGGGVRMVNGREYPIGRAWTNDHRHENKSTKWEVPQADRVRKFATGGGLTDNYGSYSFYLFCKLMEVYHPSQLEYDRQFKLDKMAYNDFVNSKYNQSTIGEYEAMENYLNENEKFATGGGVSGLSNQELEERLGFVQEDVKRVLKNAPNEFLDYPVKGWENIGTLLSNIEIASDLTDDESKGWLKSGEYATGGTLTERQQRIDLNKNGKLDAEDFAMLRNSMKGSWRNDRKHVNHSDKREVRYAKKTGSNRTGYKGRKEYGTGGSTDKPKEPIAFETSNLYYNGKGKDINGNSVVRVSFPNSRAFSIQTNGTLPKTHREGYDEMEINQYVKEYGSPAQKKKLKIYK